MYQKIKKSALFTDIEIHSLCVGLNEKRKPLVKWFAWCNYIWRVGTGLANYVPWANLFFVNNLLLEQS